MREYDYQYYHSDNFLRMVGIACETIGGFVPRLIVQHLVRLRERGGRLFVLGIGGSAANASHAVNDFRKLCHIEAYCPTDNVAELTARANDEGWETVFCGWLDRSNLSYRDGLFILSVGGGNKERNVSIPLIRAIDLAIGRRAEIFGIVGRADGYLAKSSHLVVVVPNPFDQWITPITEAMQSVVLHCLVSHPDLQKQATKW